MYLGGGDPEDRGGGTVFEVAAGHGIRGGARVPSACGGGLQGRGGGGWVGSALFVGPMRVLVRFGARLDTDSEKSARFSIF